MCCSAFSGAGKTQAELVLTLPDFPSLRSCHAEAEPLDVTNGEVFCPALCGFLLQGEGETLYSFFSWSDHQHLTSDRLGMSVVHLYSQEGYTSLSIYTHTHLYIYLIYVLILYIYLQDGDCLRRLDLEYWLCRIRGR